MTDNEIIDGLLRREEAALAALQEKYRGYCEAVAGRIVADPETAEEVCSDVWLGIWQSIPPAKPENLRLYIGKTARNRALHRLERENAQKRSGVRIQLEELGESLPDRAAAIAAIVALLCGTVYAAVMSVKVEFTDRTWVYHHEVLREDVLYTDIEVDYELTEQEISEEAMEFVTDYLDKHLQVSLSKPAVLGEAHVGMTAVGRSYVAGSHWWEEDGEWKRPEGLNTHYFRTLAEAEDFFGMEFALPDWILEAEPHAYSVVDDPGAGLRVLTPPLVEEGEEVLLYLESASIEELEQRIVPGYVELTFKIDGITPELSGVSGMVLFAVNEEAALGGYTYEVSLALDYLGEPSYPALDIEGLDGSLVVFPSCETDPGSVNAYYTCSGVAYILHAFVAEDAVVEDPAQLLLPYLEQIG